jgi:hypothetical protein
MTILSVATVFGLISGRADQSFSCLSAESRQSLPSISALTPWRCFCGGDPALCPWGVWCIPFVVRGLEFGSPSGSSFCETREDSNSTERLILSQDTTASLNVPRTGSLSDGAICQNALASASLISPRYLLWSIVGDVPAQVAVAPSCLWIVQWLEIEVWRMMSVTQYGRPLS